MNKEIIFILFIIMGMMVPLMRFISLGFYHNHIRGRYYLGIILAVLALGLLFVIPENVSILLIGPLLSLLIFDFGESWFLKRYGEPVFEVDENKLDQSKREVRMGLFDSLLTTIAIIVPLLIYQVFS